MSESDDLGVRVLFEQAADTAFDLLSDHSTQTLSGTDFTAAVMLQIERHARIGRALAVAQGAALFGLMALLAVFVESRLLQWFQAASLMELLLQSPWWLAGFMVGVSLLLAPRSLWAS